MKLFEDAPRPSERLNALAFEKVNENDGLYKLVGEINSEYLFWDTVKYKSLPDNITHEELWSVVKYYRYINQRRLRFGSYSFGYNILVNSEKTLHEFDMKYGGQIQRNGNISQLEKQQYLLGSIMEEAISSSQIEGAVTTRQVAKEMLRKQRPPRNKSEQMIVNNYQTIQFIRQNLDKAFSKDLFIQIQKSITLGTLENQKDEGSIRNNDEVRVIDSINNEVVHQPPSFEELPKLLDDLCIFFNEEDTRFFIHPVIKASIIHFMIGFIHPFTDGNGRTARAVFYWYLLKKGYWLTEYLSISSIILKKRIQYAKAFLYTEADENDLTYFIHFKLKILHLAYESLQAYLQRKLNEKSIATKFLTLGGINERQSKIIQWLMDDEEKIITVKEVELSFSISNQTARYDLQGLENYGWIKSSFINKKKKIFSKGEKFDHQLKALKNNN